MSCGCWSPPGPRGEARVPGLLALYTSAPGAAGIWFLAPDGYHVPWRSVDSAPKLGIVASAGVIRLCDGEAAC